MDRMVAYHSAGAAVDAPVWHSRVWLNGVRLPPGQRAILHLLLCRPFDAVPGAGRPCG
jgi:hypothetical protein